MSKKILGAVVVMAVVATVFVGAGAVTAGAQSMSLCQTVDALVLAGVIAPDKVVAAKAAAGCGVAAPAASFTRNLTVGSTGADVTALQTKLGVTPATGYFGAITKAAVVAYQTANGVPSTGYVGPLTLAKLNAGAVVVAPGTPAATPVCPAGMTCTPVCPAGLVCTPVGGTATLTGGAGTAAFSTTTTDVETTVSEGAINTKVLGFKVEASDSDVNVSNVKVILENAVGSSLASTKMDRYLGKVSVYMGSTKVGSADIADFTKDGTVYSKSIALSNAVVKKGAANKATFYVTVDALASVDSVNRAGATTVITVPSVRYADASGVTSTETTTFAKSVTYTTLASSGDVKVVVSKGTSSPIAGNVQVSDTAATKGVLMVEFKVKATGSDVSFDAVKVNLAKTTTSTYAGLVSQMVLKSGSATLATIEGSGVAASSTFNLDDTYTVAAGETKTFRVYADIQDQSNFVDGASLTVSFGSFSPEDANGDVVTDTGSAAGEAQTFILNGASVVLVSGSNTPEVKGTSSPADGTLRITFDVTAFGDNDIVINKDATEVPYTIENATATGEEITSSNVTKDSSDNYTVSAGSTGRFTLAVSYASSTSNFVHVTITKVAGTTVKNITY